ncbi:MAG: Capsular polysaccharide export system protein KpsS, partial [uncultured Craurococcus sp.]
APAAKGPGHGRRSRPACAEGAPLPLPAGTDQPLFRGGRGGVAGARACGLADQSLPRRPAVLAGAGGGRLPRATGGLAGLPRRLLRPARDHRHRPARRAAALPQAGHRPCPGPQHCRDGDGFRLSPPGLGDAGARRHGGREPLPARPGDDPRTRRPLPAARPAGASPRQLRHPGAVGRALPPRLPAAPALPALRELPAARAGPGLSGDRPSPPAAQARDAGCRGDARACDGARRAALPLRHADGDRLLHPRLFPLPRHGQRHRRDGGKLRPPCAARGAAAGEGASARSRAEGLGAARPADRGGAWRRGPRRLSRRRAADGAGDRALPRHGHGEQHGRGEVDRHGLRHPAARPGDLRRAGPCLAGRPRPLLARGGAAGAGPRGGLRSRARREPACAGLLLHAAGAGRGRRRRRPAPASRRAERAYSIARARFRL